MRSDERAIRGHVEIPAPIEEVWEAWTTEAGVGSFFGPGARVDAVPDGPYEIYFDLKAPEGERGSEGCRVLAVEEPVFFAFSWNAPPHLPLAREQRTHVAIRLDPIGDDATELRLIHSGWGVGGEWDAAYAYFERAWNNVVLPRLRQRFERGPINWEDPRDLSVAGEFQRVGDAG